MARAGSWGAGQGTQTAVWASQSFLLPGEAGNLEGSSQNEDLEDWYLGPGFTFLIHEP